MKICPNCKSEMNDKFNFCGFCGLTLSGPSLIKEEKNTPTPQSIEGPINRSNITQINQQNIHLSDKAEIESIVKDILSEKSTQTKNDNSPTCPYDYASFYQMLQKCKRMEERETLGHLFKDLMIKRAKAGGFLTERYVAILNYCIPEMIYHNRPPNFTIEEIGRNVK